MALWAKTSLNEIEFKINQMERKRRARSETSGEAKHKACSALARRTPTNDERSHEKEQEKARNETERKRRNRERIEERDHTTDGKKENGREAQSASALFL